MTVKRFKKFADVVLRLFYDIITTNVRNASATFLYKYTLFFSNLFLKSLFFAFKTLSKFSTLTKFTTASILNFVWFVWCQMPSPDTVVSQNHAIHTRF
jgi:hypothetical protein